MGIRTFIFSLICLLAVGCFSRKRTAGNSDMFLEGKRLGQLQDKKLEEASGLAASVVNPGLLWTHNDSGNPAVVYLVDEQLQVRLACKLQGVRNRDWEDIAVGPGPDPQKNYVYVADIGDNNARHAVKYIYRFEEPVVRDEMKEVTITSFETIAFSLQDGKKDTEAIMIHPQTKDIYVISKREKPVVVYQIKFPYPLKEEAAVAVRIVTLPITQIVSADISPDGAGVLMKNYDNVYYWETDGKTLQEALKQKPHLLKYTEEPQGEAIAFNVDGSGFYTLSEKIPGEKTFLYYYAKRKQ